MQSRKKNLEKNRKVSLTIYMVIITVVCLYVGVHLGGVPEYGATHTIWGCVQIGGSYDGVSVGAVPYRWAYGRYSYLSPELLNEVQQEVVRRSKILIKLISCIGDSRTLWEVDFSMNASFD